MTIGAWFPAQARRESLGFSLRLAGLERLFPTPPLGPNTSQLLVCSELVALLSLVAAEIGADGHTPEAVLLKSCRRSCGRTYLAVLAVVLVGCTRDSPAIPNEKAVEAIPITETTECRDYADRVRELLKEDRSIGLDPAVVRFIEDVPGAATKDALGAPFNPPWAVWWKCEDPKELHLVGRRRPGWWVASSEVGAGAYIADIVDGLRARGFDPNADRLTIHYTIADTGSYAKFDPRVRYPARRE